MAQFEKATFGGGCFWCTEAVFQRLKGIHSVTSGYAAGTLENPSYTDVTTGETGHAEVIQIEYDPEIISFKQLLDVFWHVHDPTTMNKQGPDTGTQNRSIILYHTETQKEEAQKMKKVLEKSGEYRNPIVTQIEKFETFYTAEEYHQKYYDKNALAPYCLINIRPKIKKIEKRYASLLK